MHIDDTILTEDHKIDASKIDLVARMGANLYCRASGSAVFEVEKPNKNHGIGFDQLPQSLKNSKILSGNDLGKLANISGLPSKEDIESSIHLNDIKELKTKYINHSNKLEEQLHLLVKSLLDRGEVMEAWKVLLLFE